MTYKEQQKKIKKIQKSNHNVCPLPSDQEQCDECQGRDEEWERLLGERLIDEYGENYFLRREER